VAAGRCQGIAVRRSKLRCDRLPVRRHVLSRPVKGFKEALRVLKSGGRFFFNVWDKISENEFGETVTDALAAMFPTDPPRFFIRVPHGYHDQAQIRGELTTAGFSDIAIEAVGAKSRARSPFEAAIAYCLGTPLRNEIESRDASGLQEATQHVAEALARRFGDGPIEGRIRAYVISAA
jgi:SAM-dependent methyltransferase